MKNIVKQNNTANEVQIVQENSTWATNNNLQSSSVDLLDVWTVIKQQKWIIILLLTITLSLAASYTFLFVKPTYQADATILIKEQTNKISGFAGLANGFLGGGEASTYVRTQYEMIRNRTLARKVIDELGLEKTLESKDKKVKVSLEEEFLRNLTILPVERTNLVQINYESADPVQAAAIVNSIIDNAVQLQLASRSSTNTHAIDYLEKQTIDARERLTASENKMVDYANQEGILSLDDQQKAPLGRLSGLYKALSEASILRIKAESGYQQSQKNRSTPEVQASPLINSLKTRLVTLESNYQEKSKIFKADYPDMVVLASQISQIKSKIRSEVGNTKRSLRTQYLASRDAENKVKEDLEKYENELMLLQDKSVEYNTLKREVSTDRKLYEDLLKKLQEIKVSSKIGSSNISVIDPAVTPKKQYRPKPVLNLIVATFIGLFFGIAVAFLRNSSSQRIDSGSDLQTLTGISVLATIPEEKTLSKGVPLSAIRNDPKSAVTQAYRILATNLRFNKYGQKPRVIVVTSTSPSEGKSTTAASLAHSQAASGLKVLLVDADLRRPSIHSKMETTNTRGLSDFLCGEADYTNITHTDKNQQGLYVMTAGTIMDDPVHLLSSKKMQTFLSLATKYFDSIVIDSPPVTGFADTLILSSLSDGVVFVSDESQMEKDKITTALDKLLNVNSNVLGFVVTKAKKDVVKSDYYSKYYTQKTVNDKSWKQSIGYAS